jgi:hypothetical protein
MSTTLLSRSTGTFASPTSLGGFFDGSGGETRTSLHNADYDKWLRDWDREDNFLRVASAQRQCAEMIMSFLGQWKTAYPNLGEALDKEIQKSIRIIATLLPRFQPLDFYHVTVTKEDSVFFQLRYGELRAYVELHFGGDEAVELLYNLTKDKAVISAYGGSTEVTLAKLFEAINA